MHWLVDNKRRVIFGWSAKCGCSHLKKIYYYLRNGRTDNKIHVPEEYHQQLPENIKGCDIVIVGRNPYHRLVSGFLDKYARIDGEFRHMWGPRVLTFREFVEELTCSNWNVINEHHFTPQTTEAFDPKILNARTVRYFDIGSIDYKYIEELYGVKIPDQLISFRGGHHHNKKEKNSKQIEYSLFAEKDVYNYINKKITDSGLCFYDEEIKRKVHRFYLNDFTFFKDNFGVDYKLF